MQKILSRTTTLTVGTYNIAAFTSFMRRTTPGAKRVVLLLFSVAMLLAGGAAALHAQSLLDGFDPNANLQLRIVQSDSETRPAGPDATINANWNGGTGNWSIAGDWSPNGVPNNGGGNVYNVTIDSGGTDNVSLDINATIASLVLGGSAGSSTLANMAGTAETLTITGGLTVNTTGTLVFSNASTLSAGANSTNFGVLDVESGSTLSITGNLSNSGTVETNRFNGVTAPNHLTVSGTFTNNATGQFIVGNNNDTLDVANVGTLSNSGYVYIGTGATLNLTNQASGITDVLSGSRLQVAGTFKAGANSALAHLNSIEGELDLQNAQSTTVTPGSGTLTVSSSGILDVEGPPVGSGHTMLTISGNLSNSGLVETNRFNSTNSNNNTTNSSTFTLSGTFTNNAGGQFFVGNNNDTLDVANVGTLSNSGYVYIGTGATLNLTNQASGITDVLSGSRLQVAGTFKAGANSALANLNSIEGELDLQNAQSTTITPGSGTLTVSSSGILDVEGPPVGTGHTMLTISGNLSNSGLVETNRFNSTNSNNNTTNSSTFTLSGTFTNNAGGQFFVGNNNDTLDVANVGTLSNSGYVYIGTGATLNLTNQASGITDVLSGSRLQVAGTFKAGANSALANLNSIEGELDLQNAQSTTVTPGSGTLTVSGSGVLDVEGPPVGTGHTMLTISGNLSNSGIVETNRLNSTNNTNNTTNFSTFTLSGTFTNSATGQFIVGNNNDTLDVANVGTLSNSGYVYIGTGATLNLTNQASGITDVLSGSRLQVAGTFKAGANSALAHLNSIEGELDLQNAQSTTVTPGSGTLTVSSSGILDVEGPPVGTGHTMLTISGNLSNSGIVETNRLNSTTNANNTTNSSTFTLSGTFTNSATGQFIVGNNSDTLDVANVGTLSNSGTVTVGTGATLTITKAGTSTNSGAINIGSTLGGATLKINRNVTLAGNGTVTLSNAAGNLITGSSGAVLTNANTIQGAGNIGNGLISLVNNGTISANQSTTLFIDTNATGLTNSGTLSVSSNDMLDIEGGLLTNFNSGTSTLTGGTYSVNGGTLQLLNTTGNITTIGNGTTATSVIMTGSTAKFLNSSNANMLTNLNTIAAAGTFGIASGFNFTTAGNFTNNGTLSIGSGTRFMVNLADSLTNFNSGTSTLTGGAYIVGGTLQFANARIVTNNASITLSGANSKIVNQSNVDALATTFATNGPGAVFAIAGGRNFTTAGNFTNNGTLTVGSSNSTFDVNGNLTNFSGTTLTGGTYNVTGTLQFNNANIVTNSANITLTGTSSRIIDQSSTNALANFATNNGSFTLAGNRSFTTAGNFANAGAFTINTGSTFTLGGTGMFTQLGGTTIDDGSLSAPGAVNFQGGSLFGRGLITGALTLSSAGIISPGDSVTATGILTDTGAYNQNSGILDIAISGTTAGTKYDQLNPTTANLSGTLNISRPTGFVPTIGSTFKIMNFTSETGTFATVTGLAINSSEHFTLTYEPTDVLLTVVPGPVSGPVSTPLWAGRRAFNIDFAGADENKPQRFSRMPRFDSSRPENPTIGKRTRTVINIRDSGQLLSMLDHAVPGSNGRLTVSHRNHVDHAVNADRTMRADRGMADIRRMSEREMANSRHGGGKKAF